MSVPSYTIFVGLKHCVCVCSLAFARSQWSTYQLLHSDIGSHSEWLCWHTWASFVLVYWLELQFSVFELKNQSFWIWYSALPRHCSNWLYTGQKVQNLDERVWRTYIYIRSLEMFTKNRNASCLGNPWVCPEMFLSLIYVNDATKYLETLGLKLNDALKY